MNVKEKDLEKNENLTTETLPKTDLKDEEKENTLSVSDRKSVV